MPHPFTGVIGQRGVAGVLIEALLLTWSFTLALILGTSRFGVDRTTSMGTSSGVRWQRAAIPDHEPIQQRDHDRSHQNQRLREVNARHEHNANHHAQSGKDLPAGNAECGCLRLPFT